MCIRDRLTPSREWDKKQDGFITTPPASLVIMDVWAPGSATSFTTNRRASCLFSAFRSNPCPTCALHARKAASPNPAEKPHWHGTQIHCSPRRHNTLNPQSLQVVLVIVFSRKSLDFRVPKQFFDILDDELHAGNAGPKSSKPTLP